MLSTLYVIIDGYVVLMIENVCLVNLIAIINFHHMNHFFGKLSKMYILHIFGIL